MENQGKIKNAFEKDSLLLLYLDALMLLSIIFSFMYGSTISGAKKDAAYDYLAETALNQEKYHQIHAVYKNASTLSTSEYSDLQRKSYGNMFYRRINSYYAAGSNNNPINFALQFDDVPTESFNAKSISVSTYNNSNKLIETLQLELYRVIENDTDNKIGFDGMCYLPSTLADQIIEYDSNDNIETYDDIIDNQLSFTISGGTNFPAFSSRWTVNNIFYTDVGHHDGANAEGYLGKDNGYGASLYSALGPFVVSPNTQVHGLNGSTFFFDFYHSLFLPKYFIEYAFGKSYAADGSSIDFFTFKGDSEGWIKIDDVDYINALYQSNFSFIYGGNLFYLVLAVACLSLALLPLSKLSVNENSDSPEKIKIRDVSFYKHIFIIAIPFVISQLIFYVVLNGFPLDINNLIFFNFFGTTASLIITCHILIMLLIPLIIKKTRGRKRIWKNAR